MKIKKRFSSVFQKTSKKSRGEKDDPEKIDDLGKLRGLKASAKEKFKKIDDIEEFERTQSRKQWKSRRRDRHDTSGLGAFEKKRIKRGSPPLWMLHPGNYPLILESFRTFANKIAMVTDTEKLKIFLITGTDAKVGASTVTFNLGLMLGWEMPDRRILVVDTNIDRPSLHLSFNCPYDINLMDYLVGKSLLSDIIQKTSLSNLDIIPFHSTDNDILSPFFLQSFAQFLNEIREYYDIILFDSAPILGSSHTKIVAAKVDGVILVAEANATRFEVLEESVRQLNEAGASLLGSFLNKRRYVIPKWLYRHI